MIDQLKDGGMEKLVEFNEKGYPNVDLKKVASFFNGVGPTATAKSGYEEALDLWKSFHDYIHLPSKSVCTLDGMKVETVQALLRVMTKALQDGGVGRLDEFNEN